MKEHIADQLDRDAYTEISDLTSLTKQLRGDLRDVSGDRHIWVDTMENIRLTPGPPSAEEIAEKKKGKPRFRRCSSWPGIVR